jgi:competence protein ComFC
VPIPTDQGRVHERGFDHAALLATAAGAAAKLPVRTLLTRTRSTEPLHGATRSARAAIMQGAMSCREDVDPPSAVVLVDDIQTSGASAASGRGSLDRRRERGLRALRCR